MFAYRRTTIGRQVIANLREGPTIRGVMTHRRGPLLIFANAELLEAGRDPVPVAGEIVIERHRVDFLQVSPAVAT